MTMELNTGSRIEMRKLDMGGYEILLDGKTYIGDIVSYDEALGTVTVLINNNKYDVQVKRPIDQLIEKLGIVKKTAPKINALVSPMPGLILDIIVSKGQSVKKGEPLIILEAMKMENVFKASADVIIDEITVEIKQAVEKNQVLIKFA